MPEDMPPGRRSVGGGPQAIASHPLLYAFSSHGSSVLLISFSAAGGERRARQTRRSSPPAPLFSCSAYGRERGLDMPAIRRNSVLSEQLGGSAVAGETRHGPGVPRPVAGSGEHLHRVDKVLCLPFQRFRSHGLQRRYRGVIRPACLIEPCRGLCNERVPTLPRAPSSVASFFAVSISICGSSPY